MDGRPSHHSPWLNQAPGKPRALSGNHPGPRFGRTRGRVVAEGRGHRHSVVGALRDPRAVPDKERQGPDLTPSRASAEAVSELGGGQGRRPGGRSGLGRSPVHSRSGWALAMAGSEDGRGLGVSLRRPGAGVVGLLGRCAGSRSRQM